MTESTYYCPISARLNRGVIPLWSPEDAQPKRLGESPRAQKIADEYELLELIPEASDALFDAYQDGSRVRLVSRIPFGVDDLELITDDLLRASSEPETSGLITSSVIPDGHLLVTLDYQPVTGQISSDNEIRELFKELRNAHDQGVVHGGINDRFVNPDAPAGRRVFGFGLAEAYAAWRRTQGLDLGDLTADPRFASPAALRGEATNPKDDRYALAALALTERSNEPSELPSLLPVQGLNSLLNRSGTAIEYSRALDHIEDSKALGVIESGLLYETYEDRPIWLIPVAIALGILLLLQLASLFRTPDVDLPEQNTSSSQQASVVCSGRGVVRKGNKCQIASNTGRCGEGTQLDSARGICVSVAEQTPADSKTQENSTAKKEEQVESPYIHPVLTCPDKQERLSYKFTFSNDDINLTLGEKGSLARLSERCADEASIVYYTSNPGLASRAKTIFKEFRSSSICGKECQKVMPETPTSVVYVPHIGMLDRANEHYMFFQCCVN